MTATKEQPNPRASQPQQDEVGSWFFLLSFAPFFHFTHHINSVPQALCALIGTHTKSSQLLCLPSLWNEEINLSFQG